LRRPVDVTWNAEAGAGDELCVIELYTAGRQLPNADDVRVTTADGKVVASRVLMSGPGDSTRVLFALSKNVRGYFVYWSNPKPTAPAPKIDTIRSGLLYEAKSFGGGAVDNFDQIQRAWERSKQALGTTMLQKPMYGLNPFGPQESTIANVTGSVFAPADGEYQFALACDDRAGLWIDQKPVVFADLGPADVRHTRKVTLSRGWHALRIVHVNQGGPGWFTLGWRGPGMSKFEGVGRSVGLLVTGQVGRLDERGKTFVADFDADYQSECEIDGQFTHSMRFTGRVPENLKKLAKFEWDFGDDQTVTGETVDHVFLTEGVYPVRLTTRVGGNVDTRTTSVFVSRQWARSDDPPTEAPVAHSARVVKMDVSKMSGNALVRATRLHIAAGNLDATFASAKQLASSTIRIEPAEVLKALKLATDALREKKRADDARAVWGAVPKESALQPRAAVALAETLMWWTPDFKSAVDVLRPFETSDDRGVNVTLGQALILAGRAEEGMKRLSRLSDKNAPQKAAALTGAMARSIEFYIDENDTETGEQVWDKWQGQYPATFGAGYSVVLRTKLMERRGAQQAAAIVAEAFSSAVPGSTYAPVLLDNASKLLSKSDPKRSAELRKLLKERYPENPLSQE